MVEAVGVMSSPFAIISAAGSSSICDEPDSGLAFAVYMHLVLGALQPLCVTCRFEQGVQLRWLHMAGYDSRATAPSMLGRLVWTALWVGACGAIAQLMVDCQLFWRGGCAAVTAPPSSMPPAHSPGALRASSLAGAALTPAQLLAVQAAGWHCAGHVVMSDHVLRALVVLVHYLLRGKPLL